MYDNDAAAGDGHRGRRPAWPRRAGLVAAALACLALVAAACSSSASPGAGAGAAGGGGSGKPSALAFSRCMRAHGITAFPDPNSQGQIGISGGPGTGIDRNSPQFKAAMEACRPLLPPPPSDNPAQQAKMKAGNLKYARCMRAHGISDFPDPNSQGQLQIQVTPGGDLDPNNPRFQAANKACQHYQYNGPGGPGGFITSGGGGGS
jgi:hypothetical protein